MSAVIDVSASASKINSEPFISTVLVKVPVVPETPALKVPVVPETTASDVTVPAV